MSSVFTAARLTAADIDALADATEITFSFNATTRVSCVRASAGPWNTHANTSRWFPEPGEHVQEAGARTVPCGVEITGFESPVGDEWSGWTLANAFTTVCRARVECEGNEYWASVVATLKPGDRLTLVWFADITCIPTYVAGLSTDELWIRVDRPSRWWHRLLGRAARRRRTQSLSLYIHSVTARMDDPERRLVERYGFVPLEDHDAGELPVAGGDRCRR